MESKFVKEIKKIKKEVVRLEEVDTPQYDWDSIPSGTYVEAKIKGEPVQGVYVKEDNKAYIAQNRFNGKSCEQKYGFDYSWKIIPSDIDDNESDVTELRFLEPPADFILTPDVLPEKPLTVEVAGHNAQVFSDHIVAGCQTISRETIDLVIKKMDEVKESETNV